jgi:hypothetical protein
MPDTFPDDENGDALRRMQDEGDNLAIARDIDFNAVFPTQEAADGFAKHFEASGHRTSVERTDSDPELPWDVVVVKHMVPDHEEITTFEGTLEGVAIEFGGYNDGWGCFQQR